MAGTLQTFTLPGPSPGTGGMSYIDVQASFLEVTWSTSDRLYVPAAHYRFINLGNLPLGSPERPLVLTEQGGASAGRRAASTWAERPLPPDDFRLTASMAEPAPMGIGGKIQPGADSCCALYASTYCEARPSLMYFFSSSDGPENLLEDPRFEKFLKSCIGVAMKPQGMPHQPKSKVEVLHSRRSLVPQEAQQTFDFCPQDVITTIDQA